MPIRTDELTTDITVNPIPLTDEAIAELSDADLRRLAEILYQMLITDLRLERERLGR